ncbi:hypothetical protein [Sphingomicrobium arenosum]|uniref:hypothetical protein n=1 Tax=Sphingomicrobium arenosum TaxID=2233861 RepID=UPI00223FEE68|nr:hypothetical protein [Sphingomicrobium arenosum]
MKWILPATAAVSLAACVQYPYDDDYARIDRPGPMSNICTNVAYDAFIGQPASQQVADDIIDATGAGLFQWRRNDGMTYDPVPERVMAMLDDQNMIIDIRCG